MPALLVLTILAGVPVPGDAPELPTRAELRATRVRLLEEQPGITVQATTLLLSGAVALALPIGFLAAATSYYGVAIYMAAILITGGSLGLAVALLSAICLVKVVPKRRAIDAQLKTVEDDWRAGRCRSVPGEPPCRDAPLEVPVPVAPSAPLFIAPF